MADRHKVGTMRKTVLICILILSCAAAFARRNEDRRTAEAIRTIRLSGDDYWWDICTTTTAELKKNPELRNEIRQNLKFGIANQIKIHVQGRITTTESESDGRNSSHSEKAVRISSSLYLENIHFLEYEEKRKYTIFAYLKREDFWNQETKMIQRILNIVNQAKRMEEQQEPGYLYQYYKAYLMSYNITRAFRCPDTDSDTQSWLENKLSGYLSKMKIETKMDTKGHTKSFPGEIILDTRMMPSGLVVGIPSMGFPELTVRDGKATFFYEGLPSRRVEERALRLAFSSELVKNDVEIYEIARNRPLEVERLITMDFSDMVKVDFSYEVFEYTITVDYTYEGLSPHTVEWDMGDGNVITSFDGFKYKYKRGGRFEVTLIINKDFRVCKRVDIMYWERDLPPEPEKTSLPFPQKEKDIYLGPVPDLTREEIKGFELPPEGLVLKSFTQAQALLSYLETQKAENILTWGRVTKDTDLKGLWVVVFEREGNISALLCPFGMNHIDVINLRNVKDVISSYWGKSVIYISYY